MSSSSSRSKSLSEQGKDLLARATTGVVDHNEILAKLSFSGMTKKTKDAKMWTEEEDNLLRNAIERYGEDWTLVVQEVPGRNKLQCVQRWKKTLKPGLIKGPWKPEEDALLMQVMGEELEGDWQAISRRIPGRNAKQCKERWLLNLNPEINHGPWSAEEDAALVQLHSEIGGKWSLLAKKLPGRTEHSIKTRFLSLQRQAAKVRGWTIEEDRTILKQFMLAPNLDGSQAAVKALTGRTKKQVKQRWLYLRKHYVSIDDLATSSSHGGVQLVEQDLKMLIPHSTFSQSGEMLSNQLHMASSSASSGANGSIGAGGGIVGRVKSLARHHGSSNASQPFRHLAKKLEKSGESSSSSINSKVAIGGELLNAAYGSTSSLSLDPLSSSIMQTQTSEVNSVAGGVDPFVVGLEKSLSLSMNKFPSSSSSGISGSHLQEQSKLSMSSSSNTNRSFSNHSSLAGGNLDHEMNVINSTNSSMDPSSKTLQNAGFSSFIMPPVFPPSPELAGNGSGPFQPPHVGRADSFLTIANELDQLNNNQMNHNSRPRFIGGKGKSASFQYRGNQTFEASSSDSSPSPPPPPPTMMDRTLIPPPPPPQYSSFDERQSKPDEVMRAFSTFAQEISGGNGGAPPYPLHHQHSLFDYNLAATGNTPQKQLQQQASSPGFGPNSNPGIAMLRMDSGSFMDFSYPRTISPVLPEDDYHHPSGSMSTANSRSLRKFASSAAATGNGMDDIEVYENMFSSAPSGSQM